MASSLAIVKVGLRTELLRVRSRKINPVSILQVHESTKKYLERDLNAIFFVVL